MGSSTESGDLNRSLNSPKKVNKELGSSNAPDIADEFPDILGLSRRSRVPKNKPLNKQYLEIAGSFPLQEIDDEKFLESTWELSDRDFIIAVHVVYLKFYPKDELITKNLRYVDGNKDNRRRCIKGIRNWAMRKSNEEELRRPLLRLSKGRTRNSLMMISSIYLLMMGAIALSGFRDAAIVLLCVAVLMVLLIVLIHKLLSHH